MHPSLLFRTCAVHRLRLTCFFAILVQLITHVGSVAQTCSTPANLTENYVGPNSASIKWSTVSGVRYLLQWHEQGTPTWPNSTTFAFSFTGQFNHTLATSLVEGTAYEWRIQATCADGNTSAFTMPRSFTAQCSPITQLYTLYGASSTALQLGWDGQATGITYNIHWRVRNTTTWTGSAIATTNRYLLTGLTNATTYEWQVQPVCATSTADWSASAFATALCDTPIPVPATGVGSTSAVANWNFITGATQYELQWRATASPNWTTVNSLTASPYSLTGLQPSTAYEYRVRKLCPDGNSSAFSSPVSFSTLVCGQMFTVKSGLWTDASVWSCNRTPNADDMVRVSAGHTITVPASTTARAMSLKQDGKVVFASPDAILRFGFSPSDGLIAHYPFNGNANDESGNGRNGTVSGATLAVDRFGVPNKAYSFDGSQDFIDIGNLPTLNRFTVSGWVNSVQYGSFQCVLSGINSDFSYKNLELRIEYDLDRVPTYGRSLYLHVPHDNTWDWANSKAVVPLNSWHYVTATWDGSAARLYINGKLDTTRVISGYETASGAYFIGGRPAYRFDPFNSWFNGRLDDIRIYDRAISTAEVQNLYNLEAPVSLSAGLVAHYPFNGNANDESGNGHNGTVNGATLTTDRFGVANKAYNFDGVNNRISATTSTMDKMSVSVWFKGPFPTHTNGRWPILISFGQEVYAISSFGTQESQFAGYYGMIQASANQTGYAQKTQVLHSQVVFDDTWHHVVGVYDASQLRHKLYLDGVLVAESAFLAPYPAFSSLDIGISNSPWAGYNHAGYYKGQLDDIRIYNRTLSPAEIQALANDK